MRNLILGLLLAVMALGPAPASPLDFWPDPARLEAEVPELDQPLQPQEIRFTYANGLFGIAVTVSFRTVADGGMEGRLYQRAPARRHDPPCPDAPQSGAVQVSCFTVPPDQAAAFRAMVVQLKLCQPHDLPPAGLDGTTWQFESAPKGRPCALTRWTPDSYDDAQARAFTAAGRKALQFAGLPGK